MESQEIRPFPQKTCAVIVSYCGGEVITETVNAIIDQVDGLIIVDNHSDPLTIRNLQAINERTAYKLTILYNDENKGIASALNQGIHLALEQHCDWVLTLDHDSVAQTGMVSKMFAAYYRRDDKDNIGIIAPQSILIADPHAVNAITPEQVIEADLIHTSGNLIKADVFKEVGLFREDFFIDQVDYEFCFRLKKARLKILIVTNAFMQHRLGEMRRARFFYRTVYYYNYSPIRRYYITRNGIILSREVADRQFFIHHTRLLIKDAIKILLYESDKWAKLKMMLKGAWDGARGKLGPLAESQIRAVTPC